MPICLEFHLKIEKRAFDKNGNLLKSRGDFPRWIRELASENRVEFLDLNQKSFDEYSKYSVEDLNSKFADCYNIWRYNDLVRNYHLSKDEAKVQAREDTHFEKSGARIVAGWIKELACEIESRYYVSSSSKILFFKNFKQKLLTS